MLRTLLAETVEAHLGQAYRKLEIDSRSEDAASNQWRETKVQIGRALAGCNAATLLQRPSIGPL